MRNAALTLALSGAAPATATASMTKVATKC